jgi:hypothetical protein
VGASSFGVHWGLRANGPSITVLRGSWSRIVLHRFGGAWFAQSQLMVVRELGLVIPRETVLCVLTLLVARSQLEATMRLGENVVESLVGAKFGLTGKKDLLRVFLALAGLMCLSQLMGAQSLPTDVNTTCVVTPTQFAGWFVNGTVTLNGVVNPTNSVTFIANSNCSFYQWSDQMFLWLTSPAPVQYGSGGRIFDSLTFYDVSPLNASGQRTFIPHVVGIIRPFPLPLRAAQVGPHGLQLLFDKAGRMLEVAPAKIAASGKPLILNAAGKEVEIERATIENNKVTFLDRAGKPITGAKPILEKRLLRHIAVEEAPVKMAPAGKNIPLSAKAAPTIIAQKFIIGGRPIIIDPFGNLDPVEQAEADGSVLETQNGSLVYYAAIVNDVYAYWLTGAKTGGIPMPSVFPTTQPELTTIVNYALTKGKTFPDPDALAIEVKTAWVDASTLPSSSGYITMAASIPTYTQNANNTTWTPTGATKVATLALVGMHVVGSTQGHPEMIWSTFEHVGNTPLGTYTYNGSSGVETVGQNTTGTWLFSTSGSSGPFNQAHMNMSGANIQAIEQNPPTPAPPFTVSASDTLRLKPFGAATDLVPLNLSEGSATDANTDIISINNSVRGQLASGDIRGNYIFSGATWTAGGAAPTFNTATPPANNSNQVGTSFLTNSAMETYDQGTDTTSVGATNCFFCHSSGTSLAPNIPDGLSHIFAQLQPLP